MMICVNPWLIGFLAFLRVLCASAVKWFEQSYDATYAQQ